MAKGLIDYFVIEAAASSAANGAAAAGPGTLTPRTLLSLYKEETELFKGLKEDLKIVVYDLDEKAARVEDTGNSRADREG